MFKGIDFQRHGKHLSSISTIKVILISKQVSSLMSQRNGVFICNCTINPSFIICLLRISLHQTSFLSALFTPSSLCNSSGMFSITIWPLLFKEDGLVSPSFPPFSTEATPSLFNGFHLSSFSTLIYPHSPQPFGNLKHHWLIPFYLADNSIKRCQ